MLLLFDSSPHGCKLAVLTLLWHPAFSFIFKAGGEAEMPAFLEFLLVGHSLCFSVTWPVPAGAEPGKAVDRSITVGLDQGSSYFFCNRQTINIVSFAGSEVSLS